MEDSIKTPKLLLLRPSGTLCNDLIPKPDKDKFAYDIYKQLWSYAGRQGVEVRRTCGSSVKVTVETHVKLMFFLSYHEGILPRLARGCVILHAPDGYVFCYVSVLPSPKNQSVVWDYCRPK